jgi:acetyl-CoA synthetase
MFEGVPTFPDAGRFWQVIDKHGVNIFYTAPTAIRSLDGARPRPRAGLFAPFLEGDRQRGRTHQRGSVAMVQDHVGKNRCPIVDTWWQTETAGI